VFNLVCVEEKVTRHLSAITGNYLLPFNILNYKFNKTRPIGGYSRFRTARFVLLDVANVVGS
jgi:hypothetical protein